MLSCFTVLKYLEFTFQACIIKREQQPGEQEGGFQFYARSDAAYLILKLVISNYS